MIASDLQRHSRFCRSCDRAIVATRRPCLPFIQPKCTAARSALGMWSIRIGSARRSTRAGSESSRRNDDARRRAVRDESPDETRPECARSADTFHWELQAQGVLVLAIAAIDSAGSAVGRSGCWSCCVVLPTRAKNSARMSARCRSRVCRSSDINSLMIASRWGTSTCRCSTAAAARADAMSRSHAVSRA